VAGDYGIWKEIVVCMIVVFYSIRGIE
jgi:hypothetical protein